ncbi:MAG: hypothetical protein FWC65_02520 [Treponema sp.]|nr:hypothetical protein [Treponema sp.]
MINLKAGGTAAAAAFLLSFLIGLASRTPMPALVVRPLVFALVFFTLACFVRLLVNRFLPELLSDGGADAGSEFLPGSRINITEGDSPYPEDYAGGALSGSPPPSGGQVFMGAQADDSEGNLGNISDLGKKIAGYRAAPQEKQSMESAGSAGMDQNTQNGYNGAEGALEALPESDAFMPWEPLPLSGGDRSRAAGSESEAGQEAAAPKTAAAGFGGAPGSMDFFPDLDSMAGAFLPGSAGAEDAIEYSVSSPAPKRPQSGKALAFAGDFNAKDMASGLRTVLNKDKEG